MILCLGPTPCLQRTMVFDRLSIDAVNRTSHVREFASGKSTNVARVLRTLGDQALAITFVGGMRGNAYLADLQSAGILCDSIEVQAQTRMAITIIDRANGTATELLEESSAVRESNYDSMFRALSNHLFSARMLVLSGTLTPGASTSFYARCVELASSRVRAIVDAVGPPLLQTLVHRPLIVKPNRSELSQTLGIAIDSEASLRSAMKQLIEQGAQWVVTTDGAKETLATDGKSFWGISTPPITPVSAIGSGDAFTAGLASAIDRGEDVPQACVFAAACGAANALTPNAGHLYPADVSRLAASIQLRVD